MGLRHAVAHHDNPQTLETVRRWFDAAGVTHLDVHYGYNGIEARGRQPAGR
jgi:hypothetical protein